MTYFHGGVSYLIIYFTGGRERACARVRILARARVPAQGIWMLFSQFGLVVLEGGCLIPSRTCLQDYLPLFIFPLFIFLSVHRKRSIDHSHAS